MPLFDDLRLDLRYTARNLRRNRGFTIIAVVTLALGIGANTAVFTLVDSILFRDPAYREPARLVRMWQSFPAVGNVRLGASAAEYLDYRDRNRAFESIAGYQTGTFDMTGSGEPERVEAAVVTASFFDTLGVNPQIGQVFTTPAENRSAPKVALLSNGFWRRRFASDPAVIGKSIRLDQRPYTIVGVMPVGFEFPATDASPADPPDVWVPLAYSPDDIADRAASFDTNMIARLRPGATLEQAHIDMQRVAEAFEREHPDIYSGNIRLVTSVEPWTASATARVRPVLLLLAGAVAFVLLIACANVANLLLARATSREREIAMRTALGASASRLARQLLTESVVLTLLGGFAGYLLAHALLGGVARGAADFIRVQALVINSRVLLFTTAVSVLTGLVCGLAPALRAMHTGVNDALKQSGSRTGATRERGRLRSALVVVESASAMILLVGAGLLIHSFVSILKVPPGFDPSNVLTVRTTFNRQHYREADQRRAVERQIAARLAALPGVTTVGVTSHVPLADERQIGFRLEGRPEDETHWAANAVVSSEYFRALRIPILQGRTFDDHDSPSSPIVAVVNDTLARSYWPVGNALGKTIVWGGRRMLIIGITGDVRIKALDAAVEPTIYCSVYQIESGATSSGVFMLRTAADPANLAAAARQAIWSVDPDLTVFGVRTMESIVARSLATRRWTVSLLVAFSVLALALTVIGIYGVLSYTVAERTHEMGVRLALGAAPSRLVIGVVNDGLKLAATGIGAGVALGAAASFAMRKLLFGVGTLDPVAYMTAAFLLAIVAATAAYVPARRAARVDPLLALRQE